MEALANWQTLLDALPGMGEQQVYDLLQAEKAGQHRPTFLFRIYGRYAVLRAKRERQELLYVQDSIGGQRDNSTAGGVPADQSANA